jgi:hypothetical protein
MDIALIRKANGDYETADGRFGVAKNHESYKGVYGYCVIDRQTPDRDGTMGKVLQYHAPTLRSVKVVIRRFLTVGY